MLTTGAYAALRRVDYQSKSSLRSSQSAVQLSSSKNQGQNSFTGTAICCHVIPSGEELAVLNCVAR